MIQKLKINEPKKQKNVNGNDLVFKVTVYKNGKQIDKDVSNKANIFKRLFEKYS